MNFEAFIGAFGGVAVVGTVVVWMLNRIVGAVISESIRESVERNLAGVKSELRVQEIHLQNLLSTQGKDAEDVRSGALKALANRQTAIDARRLQAVDDIWDSIALLEPSKFIVETVSRLEGNTTATSSLNNPLKKQLMDGIGDNVGYDPKVKKNMRANSARPHVTSIVWAYYKAYETVCAVGVMNWNLMREGIHSTTIAKHESIEKLISEVLPDRIGLAELEGHKAYPLFLEEIEAKLLESFKTMLAEDIEDGASIRRAATIVQMASTAMQASTRDTQS